MPNSVNSILSFLTDCIRNRCNPTPPEPLLPEFSGPDLNKPQIPIQLVPVCTGFNQPTDIQFSPYIKHGMVVLEKTGSAKITFLKPNQVVNMSQTLLNVNVNTSSEMGLLGLAFHPSQRACVINYTPQSNPNAMLSRISQWDIDTNLVAANEKVILEVPQPFSNHKAGQLLFGADKNLYASFGDGGSAGDPQDNAQNKQTLLGKMLRINIDEPSPGKAYSIPPDNPFVGTNDALPEIWAYGLRNPWRFSFDNSNQLVVADVGQGAWEEVDIVDKGANMGWNIKEGSHCYPPNSDCSAAEPELINPIYEYDHTEGRSIIGGYVYKGTNPNLHDKYVFGDFVSGRLWALDLPTNYIPNVSMAKVYSLGQFDISPTTFGRDGDGNLYVADSKRGTVYKLR